MALTGFLHCRFRCVWVSLDERKSWILWEVTYRVQYLVGSTYILSVTGCEVIPHIFYVVADLGS